MAKRFHYKASKKKGLSAIVTTVLLIALSLAAVVVVWTVVNNTIKTQISNSESCFGNYNKIEINRQYTCYERISSTNYNLIFSISIGDIDVDKVVVSVSSEGVVKSYTLTNTPESITGLRMYPSGLADVNLSNKNGGLSYNATGFEGKIDSIKIAPYISGTLCDTADSVTDIQDCALMD